MTPTTDVIVVHATAHPVAKIHRAGFPLDHPYVERCWAPILGPSSVLVLRRMPELFKGSADPFVHLDELGRGLGIGGTGKHSVIRRTIDRLVSHRFAAWSAPGELDLYTEVPPLSAARLERVPDFVKRDHDALLADHLDALAASPPPTTDLVARLNRLQHPSVVQLDAALGR
jgi:hypothetical protein